MITNIFRWNIVHARQDGADMFGMVDVTSRYGDLDAVILLRIIHVNKTTPRRIRILLPFLVILLQGLLDGFEIGESLLRPFQAFRRCVGFGVFSGSVGIVLFFEFSP